MGHDAPSICCWMCNACWMCNFKPTRQLRSFNNRVTFHIKTFQGFRDCLLDLQSYRTNLWLYVIALFQLRYNWCLSCVLKVICSIFCLFWAELEAPFAFCLSVSFFIFSILFFLLLTFTSSAIEQVTIFSQCCVVIWKFCLVVVLSSRLPLWKIFLYPSCHLDFKPHLTSGQMYIGSYDQKLWVRRGSWASKSGSRDCCPATLHCKD